MPVSDLHPDYKTYVDQWTKCRDACEGEDCIKAQGQRYLPALDSQDQAEYDAYKTRAMFYGASSRTVRGLTGSVMRKAPSIKAPDSLKNLLTNLGVEGQTIEQLSKMTVEEVLTTGRLGLLVDAETNGETRPYVSLYYAENITNWRTKERDGRRVLSMVVLHEIVDVVDPTDPFSTATAKRIRVLRLVEVEGRDQYQIQLWRIRTERVGNAINEAWELERTIVPTMSGGNTLDFIPFTFVNPTDTSALIEKSPLIDLVNVNLSHYRTSADLEHGRHFTALPTPWVAGFDPLTTKLKIGSTTAWVASDANASAGYLEFTGAGLRSLSDALSEKEKLMAVLGARLLEEASKMAEAATTVKLRQSGEQSVLAHIAQAASEGLTRVLQWAALWLGEDTKDVSIELNQDFNLVGIDSQTLLALMGAVQSGMMSWETWFYNLKRGEIYPDNLTAEHEKDLIEMGPPMSPVAPIASNPLENNPQGSQTPKPTEPEPEPGAP